MKIFLYDKYGNVEKEYGMACARNFGTKHKKGDSRTSEGFFSIEGKYDSTEWLYTDDNGVTSPVKGQFGPRFLRLDIPTTRSIGIHGTCAPWSIGSRASHGCIRITNENILELFDLVEKGMPVIISPGTRDMKVNVSEGYYVPAVTTLAGGKRVSLSDRQIAAIKAESEKETSENKPDDSEVMTEVKTTPEEVSTIDTLHIE